MARSYSARLVALTTGVDPRWLDNLLSRHRLPGVSRRERGVERRIFDEGVLAIELTRILNLELGVSVAVAVVIASEMLDQRAEKPGEYQTSSGLVLAFPLEAFRLRLRVRLGEATEFVARVPRGRPRLSPTAGDG